MQLGRTWSQKGFLRAKKIVAKCNRKSAFFLVRKGGKGGSGRIRSFAMKSVIRSIKMGVVGGGGGGIGMDWPVTRASSFSSNARRSAITAADPRHGQ